jgi:hypothetical protein
VLSRSFVKFLQSLSILFQTYTFIFLALLLSTSLYLFPHSLTSDLTFFSFTHFLIISKFYINIFILVSSYPFILCMVIGLHLYALYCSVIYLICLRLFVYLLRLQRSLINRRILYVALYVVLRNIIWEKCIASSFVPRTCNWKRIFLLISFSSRAYEVLIS